MYEGDQVFLPVQYMKLSTSAVEPSRKMNMFPWIDWIPGLSSTTFDICEPTLSGRLWLKYICARVCVCFFKQKFKQNCLHHMFTSTYDEKKKIQNFYNFYLVIEDTK